MLSLLTGSRVVLVRPLFGSDFLRDPLGPFRRAVPTWEAHWLSRRSLD
jgi:hypothetical protein